MFLIGFVDFGHVTYQLILFWDKTLCFCIRSWEVSANQFLWCLHTPWERLFSRKDGLSSPNPPKTQFSTKVLSRNSLHVLHDVFPAKGHILTAYSHWSGILLKDEHLSWTLQVGHAKSKETKLSKNSPNFESSVQNSSAEIEMGFSDKSKLNLNVFGQNVRYLY